MRRRLIVAAVALLLAGCGYFNSLYNANRSFSAAERARRTGDRATAAREYRDAIDRAAVSYRKYPDGRWADDALLLLGRARFALEEYPAAAAAMRTLLAQSSDPSMRALGHGWLGASLFLLDEPDATIHLDSAALVLREDTDGGAFVRLWRARSAFHGGRDDAGWADLTAAARSRTTAREAALEGVSRALHTRDSARTFEFMRQLAGTRPAGSSVQQIDTLLRRIGADWSPAIAFHGSAPLARADWPPAMLDVIALTRAQLAADAGQPEAALDLALHVASAQSGGAGSRARRVAARIRLERAQSIEELEEVRALLVPAFDDRGALELMRRIRAAQILIGDGQDPDRSLSLFAAAELVRDEVGAPLLARRLFLDFAALQQQPWAGKAVLAAHEIQANDETAAALDRLAANPYVRSVRGTAHSAEEIDRAEQRLAFGLEGLRADALAEAIRRDVVVGRAVTVLDSTRTAARNDSIRIACGTLIDSLRIGGIRADSTRSACLRGDSARVSFVLGADTVLLRDTTASGMVPDTSRLPLPPDTTDHPG